MVQAGPEMSSEKSTYRQTKSLAVTTYTGATAARVLPLVGWRNYGVGTLYILT